jgi:hypothetical protein
MRLAALVVVIFYKTEIPIMTVRFIPRISILISAAALLLSATACSTDKDPNERVTGDSGSKLLRLSSKQVTVDLNDKERATLTQVQDKLFPSLNGSGAVAASAWALEEMGFKPVKADPEVFLVEAQKDKVIGVRWREAIRAIFKSRGIPLSAKPDHESVNAVISVRPGMSGSATLVRARFTATIWDTAGDSKTTTVTDREIYDKFFLHMGESLSGAKHRPPMPENG